MSTRCHIEFMWGRKIDVRLYHHSDGYPSFMLPKIVRFLEQAANLVTKSPCRWWDGERLAGIFVAWSIGDYYKPSLDPDERLTFCEDKGNGSGWGVPVFQPCLERHGDIEYLWRINPYENGKATIMCFSCEWGGKPKEVLLRHNFPEDDPEETLAKVKTD